MANVEYHERKTAGKRHYVLEGRVLTVSGDKGIGTFKNEFDLADVAPHFERTTGIHPGIRRAAIYLCFVVGIGWAIRNMFGSSVWLIGVAALFALPALIIFLRFWRPIDVAAFRTHAGVVAFDIIREKYHAEECDRFLDSLRAAIKAAQVTKV